MGGGGWLEGSLGGWVCSGVGGGGVHGGVVGWRVHGVRCIYSPTHEQLHCQTFHFMNTHPPIKHIQSIPLLLYIYSPIHEVTMSKHFIL